MRERAGGEGVRGLALPAVKLASEKTSDWSATASSVSTTSERRALAAFVSVSWVTVTWGSLRVSLEVERRGGGARPVARPRPLGARIKSADQLLMATQVKTMARPALEGCSQSQRHHSGTDGEVVGVVGSPAPRLAVGERRIAAGKVV